MGNPQTVDLFYKIASIVSPFIAASIAAVMTFFFAAKAKKLDILYANKVPALKAIAAQMIECSYYASGVLAYLQGNEWAGNYQPPGGSLGRRGELAHVLTMNNLFLTDETRLLLDKFLNQLARVCAAEARFASDPTENLETLYLSIYDKAKECITALHKELYRR